MLRKSDSSWVEELYREYGGLVYRRCLRLLRDREEALSGVQEVFLRLMGRMEKEIELGAPRRYLYTAATNYCLNRIRDRKPMADLCDFPELATSESDDPARLAELRAYISLTLEGLTETERLVLYMYYGDGMTQEEIAEAVDLSRKTVLEMLARLKETLRLSREAEAVS